MTKKNYWQRVKEFRPKEFFNPPKDLSPQNGLIGLRWFKYDFAAGLTLSPVVLIFALNIASLSHAPLMSCIVSAIVAATVALFIGGSFIGVAGAAAALSSIIAKLIDILGQGDIERGYILVLPIIFAVGLLMFLLGLRRWARFSSVVSDAVSESMLAWIGFGLVVSQIPVLFGVKFSASSTWGIVGESFSHISSVKGDVFFIGISTLVFLLGMLFAKKHIKMFERLFMVIPAQAIAAFYALGLSYWLNISPEYLIQIPSNPFSHGFVLPKFNELYGANIDWWDVLQWGFMLFFVDSLEATITARAIDAQDPYCRRSDPNLTLVTMGFANMLGSFFGSLTHIWGGLKSTLNRLLGAKTLWAGFFGGLFAVLAVSFAATREVINHLPISGLSAIILVTAGTLCAPKVWKKFWQLGHGQFVVFATGFAVSALTGSILKGVAASFVMDCVVLYWSAMKVKVSANTANEFILVLRKAIRSNEERASFLNSAWQVVKSLLRNPIGRSELQETEFHMFLRGPLVFINHYFIPEVPKEATRIVVHCGRDVYIVDSSAMEELHSMEVRCGGGICLESLKRQLQPIRPHPRAMHVSRRPEPIALID